MANTHYKIGLFIFLSLTLSACGGGSSGGDASFSSVASSEQSVASSSSSSQSSNSSQSSEDTSSSESSSSTPIEYSINVNIVGEGEAFPDSATIGTNESLSIELVPQEGYRLVQAGGCGGSLIESVYVIDTVDESCSIAAEFSPIPLTVSVETVDYGRHSEVPENLVYGDSVVIEFIPDEGFYLESVAGCSGELSDNTLVIDSLQESCLVRAQFVELPPLPGVFRFAYRFVSGNRIEIHPTLSSNASTLKVFEEDVFGEPNLIAQYNASASARAIPVMLLDAVNSDYQVFACNVRGCTQGQRVGGVGTEAHAIKKVDLGKIEGDVRLLDFSGGGEYIAWHIVDENDHCERSVSIKKREGDSWIDFYTIDVLGSDYIIEAHFSGDAQQFVLVQGPYSSCGEVLYDEDFVERANIVRYFEVQSKTEMAPIQAKFMEGLDYWNVLEGSTFSFDGNHVALAYEDWVFTFEWEGDGWSQSRMLPLVGGYVPQGVMNFSRDGKRLVVASTTNLQDSESGVQVLAKSGMVSHNIPPITCELEYCFGAMYVYERYEEWELEAALDARVIDWLDALDGAHLDMEVNADATRLIMYSNRADFFITYNKHGDVWVKQEDYYLQEWTRLVRMSASGERVFYWDEGPQYLRWDQEAWKAMYLPDNFIEPQFMYEGIQFDNDAALYMIGREHEGWATDRDRQLYLYKY